MPSKWVLCTTSLLLYLGECLANTLRTYASPQEISAGVPGRMLGEYFTYLRESSADLSGDNNGNLLSERRRGRTIRRFTYDGANRLASVDDGVHLVEYLYDIDGRLLERSESAGPVTATERYRRAGGKIVMILRDGAAVRTLYSVDDEGRILRRRDAERLRPAPSSHPHSLFVLHDGLRSVCRLVDVDGVARRSEEYDPWGNSNADGQQALRECHGYRQGYRDSRTRLINFGRRWYDASIGRWTSQDPSLVGLSMESGYLAAAVPDLVNLYAYVGNDPLNVADLMGLGLVEWLNNLKKGIGTFIVLEKAVIVRSTKAGEARGTQSEKVRRKMSPEEEPEGEGGPEPESAASEESDWTPAEGLTSGEEGSNAAKYVAVGAGALGIGTIITEALGPS